MNGKYSLSPLSIITPDDVIQSATLEIEDGYIAGIRRLPRVHSCDESPDPVYCLPGFIDLHNDGIERDVSPRPNTMFPLEMILPTYLQRLVGHGITTIFHSLSLEDEGNPMRTETSVANAIRLIGESGSCRAMRQYVHLRYEISNHSDAGFAERYLRQGLVHLLSLMDHTPGQGQYRDPEHLYAFIMRMTGVGRAEAMRLAAEKWAASKNPETAGKARELAALACSLGIPVASHDDDSPEKVKYMRDMGVGISEFPITLDTAVAARDCGMHVIVGAPNCIMDKSTSGNLRATEAIVASAADILCSDYLSSGILHAVWQLHRRHGMPLYRAVNMASLYPARAAGLDDFLGSLQPGKKADFSLVRIVSGIPEVTAVYIEGRRVASFDNTGMSAHSPVRRKIDEAVQAGFCEGGIHG